MMARIATWLAVVAALCAVNAAPVTKRDTSGWATLYYPGLGACGGINSESDAVVAISHDIYGNGESCGQYIQITYNGQTQYAKTVDECQACDSGDLDLSPTIFTAFAPVSTGKLQNIAWQFMEPGWSP